MRPFRVCSRDLMAAVVTGAGIIGEFGAEGKWKRVVFMEERVSAVAVVEGEGGGRNMLGDPISSSVRHQGFMI